MSLKEKSARNLSSKSTKLFADLPAMPATLIETDGALEWNAALQEFWGKFKQSLGESLLDGDSRTTTVKSQLDTFTATITTEYATRIYADATAEARKTEAISAAAADATSKVSIEATARAGADGFLSGKYTLKVAAGNVVTGMNVTSSSGGGTDISNVTFNTDNFIITNANGTVTPFDIRAGTKIVFGVDIQSDNYSAASAGWRLSRNGDFEGNGGTFRGALDIGSGANRVQARDTGFTVGDDTSDRYIKINNWAIGSSTSTLVKVAHPGYVTLLGSASIYGHGVSSYHSAGVGFDLYTNSLEAALLLPSDQQGRIYMGGFSDYIEEYHGINLHGQGAAYPIRIVNAALHMNGGSELGTSFTAGRIYWSSSVYLYESGGVLYLNDGNGDRALT